MVGTKFLVLICVVCGSVTSWHRQHWQTILMRTGMGWIVQVCSAKFWKLNHLLPLPPINTVAKKALIQRTELKLVDVQDGHIPGHRFHFQAAIGKRKVSSNKTVRISYIEQRFFSLHQPTCQSLTGLLGKVASGQSYFGELRLLSHTCFFLIPLCARVVLSELMACDLITPSCLCALSRTWATQWNKSVVSVDRSRSTQ